MDWQNISDASQLAEINQKSLNPSLKGVLIFKHSTRCSISSMALNRLERDWDISVEQISTYFLDLLQHKDISNMIAEEYDVQHASPQVLLVKDGKCIYSASHYDIRVDEIRELL